MVVVVIFASQFAVHRDEKAVEFEVREICGKPTNLTFKAYIRGGVMDKNHPEYISTCKDEFGNINPLGCYGKFRVIFDQRYCIFNLDFWILNRFFSKC